MHAFGGGSKKNELQCARARKLITISPILLLDKVERERERESVCVFDNVHKNLKKVIKSTLIKK
jgi:hypothetical protein